LNHYAYLNDPYLDVIIAHELGHIENRVKYSTKSVKMEMIEEIKADFFSVKICGKKRVLESSEYHDISKVRRKMIIEMRDRFRT